MKEYISLHNHSHYSILDAPVKINQYLEQAQRFGMKSFALTDHGTLSGIYSFKKECELVGIKPILGCEFYLNDNLDNTIKRNHIVALARNIDGWRNLIKLNHLSFKKGYYYRPRITHEMLYENIKGLTVTSACIFSILRDYLLEDREKDAIDFVCKLWELTNKNFYLELIYNEVEGCNQYNNYLIRLSQKTGVPIVVTNDTHFIKREDYILRSILVAIKLKRTIAEMDKNELKEIYFKDYGTLLKTLIDVGYDRKIIEIGLKNTLVIDETVENFDIVLPELSIPRYCVTDDEATNVLTLLCCDNFEKKIIISGEYFNDEIKHYFTQLEHELNIIRQKRFSNYFLIMWDIVDFCQKNDIYYGVGRGSAAGSIVSYILGITRINPIKMGLFFERFLTIIRRDPPDIDMDFESFRRNEVEQYIIQKYGIDNVVHVLTFGKFATRGVIRDIGRVFELNFDAIDKIAKLCNEEETIAANIERISNQSTSLKNFINKNITYFQYAEQLSGLIRHQSLHASGIVIDSDKFSNMPVNKVHGVLTCAFQEGAAEREVSGMGFTKFDILGLAACDVIHNSIKLIKERYKIDINNKIEKLQFTDEENKEIFKRFNAGDCEGIFQFSSSGIKDFISKVNIKNFDDLIAVNAIWRPATQMAGATDVFVHNRNHPEEINYFDSRVKLILQSTFGVIVFQEQILNILTILGGFSVEEAEEIRHSFGLLHHGKEKADSGRAVNKLRELSKEIVDRCVKNGMDIRKAENLSAMIDAYSHYTFNKAHSTAYAWLGMQTMFLKIFYPLEFFISLLNAHCNNEDKLKIYANDAYTHEIKFLPVHINKSKNSFVIERDKIRAGFNILDGIGEKASQELTSKQPYINEDDFLNRINRRIVHKRIIKRLQDENVLIFE